MLQAPRGTRSQVRGRLIAGLGVLVVLLAAAPAQAKTDPLERYARGTWASMVAMTDEHTGLPADFVDKHGMRSTPTSPTNIGAYLWSAVAAERLGIIGHRRGGLAASHARSGRSRRWSAATPASTSTGTTSATGRSRRPHPAATPPHRSSPRSTTAGSRPACARWRAASPSCTRARRRCSTRWTSASTTGRTSTGSSSTTCPRPARRCAATTRPSPRAGSRPTSASSRAGSRSASTTGRTARSPTPATGPGPRRGRSGRRGSTSARPCSRARCRTRGCG